MGKSVSVGIDDLATLYPELVPEWSIEGNSGLLPTMVSASGKSRYTWCCRLGHLWQSNVYDRLRGHGCPVCAGIKVWPGFNDMLTTHPALAAQLHPTMNSGLSPTEVIAGTNRQLWWMCEFGHTWQARSADRVKGSGCPVCSGRQVLAGFNDLATTNPALAEEWNYRLNGEVTPEKVKAGTHNKYWWTCPLGHDYLATTKDRNQGSGCPLCAGKSVITGINDLATTHPKIASEWDFDKNGHANPSTTYAGTKSKFWWRCSMGHQWQASLAARSSKGDGCPVCSGNEVWEGHNDLATTHPALAAEWHPTRNLPLLPTQVMAGTNQKIWWICARGHEWQTQGNMRFRGHGCPVCSNKKVLAGFNDLASTAPLLAAEWHPTKNAPLKPSDVVQGTKKKLWWVCKFGHEWRATGSDRSLAGQGCPTCAPIGFDPNKRSILYFISNKALAARKIGITNAGGSRLDVFGRAGWRQIMIVENADGHLIQDIERAMLNWIRKEHHLPQHLSNEDMKRTGGATETFGEDGPSDYEIMERIRTEFANSKQHDG